jgi:hypothetical protein
MALENKYNLTVNLKAKRYGGVVPNVTANDNTVFEIYIIDDTVAYPLLNTYRYTLVTYKKNKASVIREGSLTNGLVRFELGSSETTVSGKVEAMVQIYDEADNRISSAPLTYNVIGDPSLNGSLPVDDTSLVIANESLFLETIEKAETQKQRVDDLIAGTPQPSEVIDSRGGFPVLRDRLNDLSSSLAQNTTKVFEYKLIGEEQNKSQQKYTYPNRINFGTLNDAPIAKVQGNKGIDLIAHWYNDFGLEFTASAAGETNGSYTWYDWKWNHEDDVDYDPSRKPLLGYYKGDDPKVLDWQSYWLVENGINAVIPAQSISTTNWATPSNRNHWAYQLFNNTKNFKSLNYIPWIKHDGTSAEANAQHDDVVNNLMAVYKNLYVYRVNGKRYVAVFIWDNEVARGTYDSYNGSVNLRAEYKRIATNIKALGYDGVCVMARTFDTAFTASELTDLEANGVMMLKAGYSTAYGTHASYSNLFSNYVNNVTFPTDVRTAITVQTSSKTQLPHPSGFSLVGSTPELFKKVLQKAVDHVVAKKLPKLVLINNVAEWAENGAGLQPDKLNGFGYLDAVKGVKLGSQENIDLSKIERKSVYGSTNVNGGGAPASYTPSLANGNYHTVPFSGATTFTFNNPTNGKGGDELILQVSNGNTSTAIPPAFGTAYKFTITPVTIVVGKKSIYRFISDDGATWYLTGYTENI